MKPKLPVTGRDWDEKEISQAIVNIFQDVISEAQKERQRQARHVQDPGCGALEMNNPEKSETMCMTWSACVGADQ